MKSRPHLLFLLLVVLFVCPDAKAQFSRAFGWCEQGGQAIVVSGLPGAPLAQASYPQCTITVFLTGTTTPATIYSDKGITPLGGGTFKASANGYWFFYAATGTEVDIQESGSGLSTFTWGDVTVGNTNNSSPLSVNGAVVPLPNLVNSSSVSFSVVGNNITATSTGGSAVSVNGLNLPSANFQNSANVVFGASAGNVTASLAGVPFLTSTNAFTGANSFSVNPTFLGLPALSVSGVVTPGHCGSFLSATVLQDAGANCGTGGSGSPAGPEGSLQLYHLGSFTSIPGFAPDSVTSPTILHAPFSLGIKGPAPWYDVREQGAIPYVFFIAQESTTATCTGGTSTCTLAAAKNFQNNEGIVIYTGGAATGQSTPSAPTVTSPTVTGSSTFHYQCAGLDATGGLTAASASGSVASAPAIFEPQPVVISSISVTANVATVNFATPINATGGSVQHVSISGVTGPGATWNGYWLVATAPTASQITYAITTANGTGTVSASSLGRLTNTAGITAITRTSDGVIHMTTDANHNFLAQTGGVPRTIAIINGATPGDLNGEYELLTAATTSLTAQSSIFPASTETGSVTTGFSNVTVYEQTTVTCPAVSAPTVNYAVYGDSPSGGVTLTYLGETMYGQRIFVDGGPFYASSPQRRGYVPVAPPSVAQPGLFRGTIQSGGATTTIQLTSPITSTVTNATIVHDESLGIQNALNAASANGGGAAYLSPIATQFSQYAINYPISIPQFVDWVQGSEVIGNEPVTMQGFNRVYQSPFSGSAANQCSTQFPSAPHYQCWQGVAKEYLHQSAAASADFVDGIGFTSSFNGQNYLVFDGSNGGYGEVKNTSFTCASFLTCGSNVGLTYLNNVSQLNDFHLSGIASMLSGPLGAGGQSGTQTGIMAFSNPLLPAILFRCGDGGAGTIAENVGMDSASNRNEISYKGILIDVSQCGTVVGQNYHFDDDHDQAATTPFVSVYGHGGTLNTFNLEVGRVLVDSACIAVVGNFSRMGGQVALNEDTSCGGVGLFTGDAAPSVQVTGLQTPGNIVGQNTNFRSDPSISGSNFQINTPVYSLDNAGNQTITTLNQTAANNFAGTSACVTSTKTITFPVAYVNTPVITVSDETTTGGARVSAHSNSAFTVTCTGATDAFDYVVVANPN